MPVSRKLCRKSLLASSSSTRPSSGRFSFGGQRSQGRTSRIESLGASPFLKLNPVQRFRLSNGLQILMLQDASAPVISYQTWFRVGSRDEHPGITGIAHLFEHLMFKETRNLPEGAFSRILEEAGARDVNAWTWCDETVYTQSVPRNYLELVVKLESDRMANLILNERQLSSEREVVLNERRFTTEDDPFGRMAEVMCNTAFDVHPYRWPVIGARADVEGITLEDCLDFYRRFYSPNNAVLILCGDLDIDHTLDLIERYYGDLPSSPIERPAYQHEAPRQAPRRAELELQVESEVLQAGFMIPGLSHPDRAALTMLDLILVQGRGSRLVRRLVNSGLASSVDGGVYPFRDPCLFEIQVGMREGHSVAEAEAALFEEAERLVRDGVSVDELARARQKFQVDAWQELRDNSTRANFLGIYEMASNGFESGLDLLNRTLAVTPEEVQAVAARYLTLQNATLITARPSPEQLQLTLETEAQAEADLAGEAQGGESDDEDDFESEDSDSDGSENLSDDEDSPALERARAVTGSEISALELEDLSLVQQVPEIPKNPWKVDTLTLPQGGHLYVVEEQTLPLVSFQLLLPGGMGCEPAHLEGVTSLLGDFLTRGTRTRSREDFEDALDAIGASLDIIADVDHLTIVGSTLASNFRTLIELLQEALTQPRFDPEELERLKGETIANIRDGRNDDKTLADFWFARLQMFPHPYGRSNLGTPESVAAIQMEDVARIFAQTVRGGQMLAGVAGAVLPEEAHEIITRLVESLPEGSGAVSLGALPSYEKQGTLFLIDKPERSQTQIMLGHRGIATGHPDYPLLALGNAAFGGPLSTTRMMMEVREKRGWSYGASSRFDIQREGGTFHLWVFPSVEDAVNCLALIKRMYVDLKENGLTASELEYGRRAILNGAAFDEETPERSMRGLINRQWQGINRVANLQAVAQATLEQVNSALARVLDPDELMAVMVCTADAVKESLAASGLMKSIEVIPYDAA